MTDRIETTEVIIKDNEGRIRIRLGMEDLDDWGTSPVVELFDADGDSRLRMRVSPTGKEAPNGEGLLLNEEPSIELMGRGQSQEGLVVELRGNEPVVRLVDLGTAKKLASGGNRFKWVSLRIRDGDLVVCRGVETPRRTCSTHEYLLSEIQKLKEQLASLAHRFGDGGNE